MLNCKLLLDIVNQKLVNYVVIVIFARENTIAKNLHGEIGTLKFEEGNNE